MTDSNEIAGTVVANPGLDSDEVARRQAQYGPNALEEKRVSVLRQLLGYFWGPIPWMIEVAAVLSALVRHLADFLIIITLLIFNAAVGFWQEYTAGNAVTALMKQLALRARVRRDARWQEIDARQLVPGDIVRIRPGDVIPADIKLVEGDYLSIDQNDVPIMTIAYDHTGLEKNPVRWNMQQVITVATAMGIVGVIGSFGMLLIAMDWMHLDVAQIQTYVFLKMAVAGHLVLFVARSKGHFWQHPWPAPIMIWSAIVTKLAATLLAAYGFGLITPIT